MPPTQQSVSDLAYELWLRRGREHGGDQRDWLAATADLRFFGQYELIAHAPLDQPAPGRTGRRCRFCERSAGRTTFQTPPPIWPGGHDGGLRSGEICDECQAECREPLVGPFDAFWSTLGAIERARPAPLTLAILKAVAASLVLITPEDELEFLGDTIEWVGNPDQDDDASLFTDAWCRVYLGDPPRRQPWAALARRRDDDAGGPYLVGWLGRDDLVIESPIPLCVRDQDRDTLALSPERSFVLGSFAATGRARSTLLSPAVLERA